MLQIKLKSLIFDNQFLYFSQKFNQFKLLRKAYAYLNARVYKKTFEINAKNLSSKVNVKF